MLFFLMLLFSCCPITKIQTFICVVPKTWRLPFHNVYTPFVTKNVRNYIFYLFFQIPFQDIFSITKTKYISLIQNSRISLDNIFYHKNTHSSLFLFSWTRFSWLYGFIHAYPTYTIKILNTLQDIYFIHPLQNN